MGAITVANPLSALPAATLVISVETLDQRDLLLDEAHGYIGHVTDDEAYESADRALAALAAFGAGIEKGRKALTEPALAYQRALMKAANEACIGVEDIKDRLAKEVNAYKRKRDDERAAAIAEARRKEEEARGAAEAVQEANVGPGDDAPVFQAPPKVAAVPIEAPRELKSSASSYEKPKVVIDDMEMVPLRGQNGVRLWKDPDLKAIEVLLKAGLPVPGCRLVMETVMSVRGR